MKEKIRRKELVARLVNKKYVRPPRHDTVRKNRSCR